MSKFNRITPAIVLNISKTVYCPVHNKNTKILLSLQSIYMQGQ